ncbi:MAG: hypothetical protein WBA44_15750 [Mesorhizobium sp.]
MAPHAVARETVVSLRREIARIEGRLAERLEMPEEAGDSVLLLRRSGVAVGSLRPIGSASLDQSLGGGVATSGLTEIHAAAMRDAAAAAGFALGLAVVSTKTAQEMPDAAAPILWAATAQTLREAGRPYMPGLVQRFGLQPQRMLFADVPRPVDALWVAEEAASAGVFSAIIVEIGGDPRELDLTATRRLHRRALGAGCPLYLLRLSATVQSTAAPVRLVVQAAPAAPRRTLSGPLAGSIGPPAFHVTIGKSRTAIPASVTLEWTHGAFHQRDDERPALPGIVVPLSAGGADHAPALRQVVAFAGAGRDAAGRIQPPREQHPAGGRPRRAG